MTNPANGVYPSGKVLLLYLSLVFIFTYALQVAAIATTHNINSAAAELWLVGTMFVPALITVIFLLKYKQLRSKILWKPGINVFGYIFIAILIPVIIAFTVVGVIQQLGFGTSGWFGFSAMGVNISGGPWIFGTGKQTWLMFAGNVLVTGTAYSLFNAIPAAGEEFAWRGFLQGWLTDRYGTVKGIVLLGFIWSMWHLPAQLAGYNYPGNPLLGSFIMSPVELIAVSLFLGWLTIKSKSLIPAAVAHGAGNSIQEGVIDNLKLTVPRLYLELSTLLVTVFIGIVFWLFLSRNNNKR